MNQLRRITVPLLQAATLVACLSVTTAWSQTAPQAGARTVESWRRQLNHELPLLGHRNWILIVDSAYPLQTSPGVETIETGASMPEVTRAVLQELGKSIQVRPNVYRDTELAFLSEKTAPGVTQYRDEMRTVLGDRVITELPHEQIISRIDEAGKVFHVLILKTTLAVPYTSVFLQLDCKYWSAASEAELRSVMKSAGK